NVDDRLCLWVNTGITGSGLIPFSSGAEYAAPGNYSPQNADLAPVGIGVKGAVAKVSKLMLSRDIYYRADYNPGNSSSFYEQELPETIRIRENLNDPEAYGDLYRRYAKEVTFRALGSDEFFVMGDNSPRSQDSRLWPNERHAYNRHAVPRQALLGK